MAFLIVEPSKAAFQQISDTSTTKNHNLGTMVEAYDSTYGYGRFIYLQGVASTVIGSVVTYDSNSSGLPTWTTTLAPSTAGLAKPLAVAMSANVANQYGWYMVQGTTIVATNGTFAAAGVGYLAGSGQVTSTQANGKQLVNFVSLSATGTPAANQCVGQMAFPFAQGQIV